jgi:protein involved in polysaccharide export with SLBB domain
MKLALISVGFVTLVAISAGLVADRGPLDSSGRSVEKQASQVLEIPTGGAPIRGLSEETREIRHAATPPVHEPLVQQGASVASTPAGSAGANRRLIERGDKLRIIFYEQLTIDEDKWDRARHPRSGFQQRMELSGEYNVEEDGTISLPLLGSILVEKVSIQELQTSLAFQFEKVIGRRGFVTIASLDRLPIYVLGPVKNPGTYKYAPAMTALHAVALAGGLDRGATEQWQKVEAVRETERRRGSLERMMRLIARTAVLKSERDGVPLVAPPQLIEIATETEAQNLLNEETERRQTALLARSGRGAALKAAVENARGEVEAVSGRIAPLEDIIRLREQRVNNLRSLISRNVIDNAAGIQAQSELSDVQERRQDALRTISLAKQRLALAEQEWTRDHTEARIDVDRLLETAQQQIAEAQREIASSEGVLNVIKKGDSRTAAPVTEAMLSFEIVRRTPKGPVVLAATGTTSLEPGDLVQVSSSNAGKARPDVVSAEDPSVAPRVPSREADARRPNAIVSEPEPNAPAPNVNANQKPAAAPADPGDQGKRKQDTRADAIAVACEEIRALNGGRDHNTPDCRQFDRKPSTK